MRPSVMQERWHAPLSPCCQPEEEQDLHLLKSTVESMSEGHLLRATHVTKLQPARKAFFQAQDLIFTKPQEPSFILETFADSTDDCHELLRTAHTSAFSARAQTGAERETVKGAKGESGLQSAPPAELPWRGIICTQG